MKAPQSMRISVLCIVVMLLAGSAIAYGEPTAPLSFDRGASSTFNWSNIATKTTTALAGNITWLTITGLSQTRAWQGYYGNVSGYITLDDAQNYTFYNWTAAEPRGYLYATRHGSPSWLNVQCFDFAGNATKFDDVYNIPVGEYDNVTNTYASTLTTYGQSVYIVSNEFTTCPATAIYRDDNAQSEDFVNYLMWDSAGNNESWVFGTIIENKDENNKTDITCYNGAYCDFQLLVAEDGHGTDTATTTYYFWADLQG